MPCDTPQPPPKTDPYSAWRIRSYQLYAASWFLMTFAKQIETVAMGIYVYGAANKDPLALGGLGLVQALPVVALSIAGGHIADRFDRRNVLAIMLALAGVVSLALTAAVHAHVSVGWIYLLLLAGAVGQALGGPSRSAILARLVPAADFSNAVAWSSSIFQVARVTGPALGGLVVAGVIFPSSRVSGQELAPGAAMALTIVVVCRLLAMLFTLALPRRNADARPAAEEISWKSVWAGVAFVWRHKPILATITLDLFAVLFGGATYLFPIFAMDILKVGPSGVGYLQSADAAGAILMFLLLAHLPPIRRAGWTMLWCVAAFGAATIVFGLSTCFWLSLAMMFLAGAVDGVSVVVRHTLVQMLTPDAMRGRVSAVNNVFIVASNDIGGLESGVTAWMFGPILSVVGGGVATILVVLASMRIWPQILAIGSLRDLKPAEEDRAPGP